MDVRKTAGCALGGLTVFVIGLVVGVASGSSTSKSNTPVPTETVTVTKTVTEKVPAKLPKYCLEAFDEVSKFQADVGSMSKSAGDIKEQTSQLQILAAFPDAVAMSALIQEQQDSIYVLNAAAVESAQLYADLQSTQLACLNTVKP